MAEPQPNHPAAAILPVAALFLLSVGFYWKLVLTDQYVWFDHPDMCYIEIPRLEFQAREIHRWHFPLWDPAIWSGQPLIGQTQPGPLYPLNLLFYLMPLRKGYIRLDFLNWYWVLIRFLAALCCYLLCRDLGRSRSASIVAGSAFAFGGFIGTVAWLDVVNGAVWTPLIFLYFFRAWRGERPSASAALCGFWLGIAWLCGHHEIPLIVSYTLLFGWIYAIVRQPTSKIQPPTFTLPALTFLIGGLVSAAQVWPTYEFARISKRWVGTFDPVGWKDQVPYTISTIYSMPARGLLGLILPGQNQADSTPYLGVAAVSLALLGLVKGWCDARVRWLAALAALATAYAMGALTPLQGVLYALAPMLSKARVPVRAIHLLNFSLAVLAAYGVDVVLANAGGPWIRRVRLGLVAFGGLLVGAAIVRPDLNGGVLLAGLIALALAGVMLARQSEAIGRQATLVTITSLLLVELYPVGAGAFPNRYDKDRNKFVNVLLDNQDIVAFLRNEQVQSERAGGSPIRVDINDQDIPANFGDWHGIDMLEGYMAGVTTNLLRHELHTKRTQMLFGVTHWIGRQPNRPDMQEVFAGASGIKVWRVPDPMPRVWAVHRLRRAKEDYEIRLAVQDPGFDLHREAVLLGDVPPLEVCPAEDQVRLMQRSTDRLTVAATLSCAGLVILSETYYPGWTATVDGKPTRIWEAWGALRGVVVPAGEHEVRFSYRPLSVYGGAVLTALGVLLTVVLVRPQSRMSSRPMRIRAVLLVFVACLTATAQTRTWSVNQLLSFLRSSIKLKQTDSQVAAEVRKVKLTERLDERTIEQLQGEGLGSKTVQALKELAATTGSLPAPPPPPPKPVYVPIPPPSAAEQKRVLAEVTDYARNYVQRLPDFICSQATRKFVDTTGQESWRQTDLVQERLTYFEKHEDYKVVMVNDRPTDTPHEKLGGAMGSSGEFGSILAEIFAPETQTEFDWSRWAGINKRPMYVFSYHVPKERSNYRITSYNGPNFADPQTIVAGHHGEILVDKGTRKVMRIYLHCEGLPAGFPVRSADLTLSYDTTRIGDSDYVLPLRAELKMHDDRNPPVKNLIQFYNYRKFSADATIQFTDAPPPSEEQPAK